MLAFKYTIFALLTTALNLALQWLSFVVYSGFLALYIAMFIGTLGGLVLKYILDKRFIFYRKPKNRVDDSKKFALYSLMGVFTTLIFWGFEIGFNFVFENANAKYFGATIGLGIGYVVKYFLDKKFVFKQQ